MELTSDFGANPSPVASGPKIPPSPLATHLSSMEYAPMVNRMILEYTLTQKSRIFHCLNAVLTLNCLAHIDNGPETTACSMMMLHLEPKHECIGIPIEEEEET